MHYPSALVHIIPSLLRDCPPFCLHLVVQYEPEQAFLKLRSNKNVSLKCNPLRRLFVFCFIKRIGSPFVASELTLTPSQVVFQQLAWYPKKLPKAATLTTTSLRKGLSQKQWIEKNDQLLKDLHFKYLDTMVLDEEREDEISSPTVKSRRFVAIGEVVQIERYTLQNVDGHWCIDGQDIERVSSI